MSIKLEPFSEATIKYVYEVKYETSSDKEWMAFNGPYFNDPVPSWSQFNSNRSHLFNDHHRLIWSNQEIVGEVSAH